MKKVIVYIDRLTLKGVSVADRARVIAELRASLAEQFARPRAVERLAATGHRESLRVTAPPPLPTERGGLGHRTGEAIGREITR